MHGKPLYYDEGHLSIPGSEMLGVEALRTNTLPTGLLEILSRSAEPLAKVGSEEI
ncbi:hypothetical protein D3C81_1896090 [compost metagenome]